MTAVGRVAASTSHAALWGRTSYGRAFTKFTDEHADALGPKSSLLILGDARSNYSDLALDKLQEMRKTVEAHTSEGRTNIKLLLLAPVLMMLMMSAVDSKGVGMLFTTTPGVAILIIAGLLAGTGAYLANRITKSEV